ncbi:MAG: glycosyltransferase family 4 protein [Spirochaetes bacterium]|nr:glycosyltransferase family 4 protein [Spirochaetota bacterium]
MSVSSSKFNILILINVRWWNATAFYALNIARLFKKNGHKVIIGCNRDYPAFKRAEGWGLETVPLDFYGYNIFRLIRDLVRMIRLIRREKIQFINSHRSEDHTFALIAKWFTKVKLIITRGDRRRISNNMFSKMRYSFSDAVVLTCGSIREQNRKVFGPIIEKVHVIYGSVDEEHFSIEGTQKSTAQKYRINLKKKIIGIVGRLDDVKDQYTFVNAASIVARKVKDAFFIIAGKEERIKVKDLKRVIHELDMQEHILILPRISDIADLMNLFDIGIVTSVGSETISRVLLEYMYLGKPVIGTHINAIGEIIQSGKNGELFDPRDYHGLAEKMLFLLKKERLRKKYSKNSLDLYKQEYSEEVFFQKYLEVMEGIIHE